MIFPGTAEAITAEDFKRNHDAPMRRLEYLSSDLRMHCFVS
jgi:hypothetical protein